MSEAAAPTDTPPSLVRLGRFERPHGVNGRLLLRMEFLGSLVPLPPGAGAYADETGPYHVTECVSRDHRRLIIGFREIDSRERAAALAGMDMSVRPEAAMECLPEMVPLGLLERLDLRDAANGERLRILGLEPDVHNPQLVVTRSGPEESFLVPVLLLLRGSSRLDWEALRCEVGLPAGIEEING